MKQRPTAAMDADDGAVLVRDAEEPEPVGKCGVKEPCGGVEATRGLLCRDEV